MKNRTANQRFLIVNGDDFGFSSGVNRAIIEAYDRGVLTSASLMVTGAAFEEAVELAKARPGLAVGLHLVLACGRSVLSPEQIPHLVDSHGNFSNQPENAGFRYHFSAAAQREIQLEMGAQLKKFCQTGLPLSHVDGHVHIHIQPFVLSSLVQFAQEFDIRFIRLPLESLQLSLKIDSSNVLSKLCWFLIYAGLRRYGEGVLRKHNIRFTEQVYGIPLQGLLMPKDYLLRLIPEIQANLIELYSHPAIFLPGEPDNGFGLGQAERDALISDRIRQIINEAGFQLTNYIELSRIS